MPPQLVLPDGTELSLPDPRGRGRPPVPPEENFKANYRSSERPVQRMRWNHDMVIDAMLANPEWDQKQLAAYFGYSEGWFSMVISSDAFQSKLAERREEVLDPAVKATIEERFRALANHSLNKLHAKLDSPNVSDNLVLRSVELAAKALGLGARPLVSSNVQVAIVVPPKSEMRE